VPRTALEAPSYKRASPDPSTFLECIEYFDLLKFTDRYSAVGLATPYADLPAWLPNAKHQPQFATAICDRLRPSATVCNRALWQGWTSAVDWGPDAGIFVP